MIFLENNIDKTPWFLKSYLSYTYVRVFLYLALGIICGNYLSSDFVYYALLHFDIKRLSFGTGQPLVKASELKVQEIMMPVEDTERTVIGEYFANLDNLITLHQRKLELRLFPGCRFFI